MEKSIKENEVENLKKRLIEKDAEIFTLKNIINYFPGDIYWKHKNGVYAGINATGSESLRKMGFIWEEGEILGKTDYDLYDVKTAEEFRNNDLLVMETRSVQTREEVAILPSGKKIIQLSTKRPLLNRAGEVIGVIGNTVDITALKEAEEREKAALLKAADEEKAKAKAEENLRQSVMVLTGSIVHDLRSPLMVLGSCATLLNRHMPALIEAYEKSIPEGVLENDQPIPKMIKDYLPEIGDDIKRKAAEMNDFIDVTLKTLSQVVKNNFTKDDLIQCSMWHCIHNILHRYPLIQEQRKIIQWDQKDFKFLGNELTMIRVFYNLLKNSLEQIEKNQKGQIIISTEITEQENKIKFRDTAGGAPPEIVEKLFDGYQTSKEKGTGVGLAFCKMALESFGAYITCESVYGEYIEFTLSFPRMLEENTNNER